MRTTNKQTNKQNFQIDELLGNVCFYEKLLKENKLVISKTLIKKNLVLSRCQKQQKQKQNKKLGQQ